jgi:hypothetical protein
LKHPELYQPLTRQELQSGSRVTTSAYIQAHRELDRIRRIIGNIFSSVDLLVMPTTPEEAKNKPEDWRSICNTSPFNIYELPSISIPCGFSRSGLPIGLQICGPFLANLRSWRLRTHMSKKRIGTPGVLLVPRTPTQAETGTGNGNGSMTTVKCSATSSDMGRSHAPPALTAALRLRLSGWARLPPYLLNPPGECADLGRDGSRR